MIGGNFDVNLNFSCYEKERSGIKKNIFEQYNSKLLKKCILMNNLFDKTTVPPKDIYLNNN